MFGKFFYTLKAKGLHVTLTEWLTLQEALSQGVLLCSENDTGEVGDGI